MEKNSIVEYLKNLAVDTLPATAPELLKTLGIAVTSTSVLLVTQVAKFLWRIGLIQVFSDYESRHLSNIQQNKLDDLKKYAIKTVYQLMEEDGYNDLHPESATYIQNIIEYSEDIIDKALNEARHNKRILLGSYLGSTIYTLYSSTPNWDNVFYLSSLIDRLTLRQIILIKLVTNNFDRIEDGEDFICATNKVVISELKELEKQNMWVGLISYLPDPTYIAIPLKYMYPTELAKELVDSILIPDSIEQSINEIIKSLDLKPYSKRGLPDLLKVMKKTKSKNTIN